MLLNQFRDVVPTTSFAARAFDTQHMLTRQLRILAPVFGLLLIVCLGVFIPSK